MSGVGLLFKPYVKLLRPHQWVKNFLVFVPAITSQSFYEIDTLTTLALAFFSFSLLSSTVYVINDFSDRHSDRTHPVKRHRPIASKTVRAIPVILLTVSMFAVSLFISRIIGLSFFVVVLIYLAVSSSYTFYLKRVPVMDVTVLSLLYSLRIVAGATALGLRVSFWLVSFSFFFFLSLAILKRVIELSRYKSSGTENELISGRGYVASDFDVLRMVGVSSGLISVLVFALYLESEDFATLFPNPLVVWPCVPILLYWFSRIWILSGRGELNEDPVLFAVKDRQSIIVGALLLGCFLVPWVMS